MVGIILISHGGMAEGMLSTATMLYPDIDRCVSLTLQPADSPDEFQDKLKAAVEEMNEGDGVVILADLLGGTPSNRAMYLLSDKVRLLTGMNIPMLVSLLCSRDTTENLDELISTALSEAGTGLIDVYDAYMRNGDST